MSDAFSHRIEGNHRHKGRELGFMPQCLVEEMWKNPKGLTQKDLQCVWAMVHRHKRLEQSLEKAQKEKIKRLLHGY